MRNVDKVGITLRINQRAINNENKIKGNGIQIQNNMNLYHFCPSYSNYIIELSNTNTLFLKEIFCQKNTEIQTILLLMYTSQPFMSRHVICHK